MENSLHSLYVGADDSNHAGDAKKGEIIVTTFSYLKEDSIVKDFPNHRDRKRTEEWVSSPHRDFRFTILTAEKYRHSSSNLLAATPSLIISFIEENDLYLEKLNIYLDGRLEKRGRNIFRNYFIGFHGIEKIVVDNFIKKKINQRGNVSKHPFCPELVYHADILANLLYSTMTFEELSFHKKLIPIK